ncbi:MAG: hypothetical protein QXX87_04590 [Candidatus Jordarchaeales archaeon]
MKKLLEKAGVTTPSNILSGPDEDAAVIRVRDDMVLVKTIDFVTPSVDEGYVQGKIAAANATSDVYNTATRRAVCISEGCNRDSWLLGGLRRAHRHACGNSSRYSSGDQRLLK